MVAKNDRNNVSIEGATNEVATLKEAVSKAEKSAAAERAEREKQEREKQEARVAEVQQELHTLVKKYESLELDSKTRAFELAVAIENAKCAKAESQKALHGLFGYLMELDQLLSWSLKGTGCPASTYWDQNTFSVELPSLAR